MNRLIFALLILSSCQTKNYPSITMCENKPHRYDEPYYQQIILFQSYGDTAIVPPNVDIYFVDYNTWLSCIDSTTFPHYKLIILE